MRRGRGAARLQPLAVPPEEGVFLLSTRQRNPEIVVRVSRALEPVRRDNFEQVALNGGIVDLDALNAVQARGFLPLREQLQCADAVAADGSQQVERLGRTRLEARGDTLADGITVGQQALEVMRDRVALQRGVVEREGQ